MNSPEYIYSENPAINLFQRLGYEYYHGEKKKEREIISEVILKDRLLAAIKRFNPWINELNLQKAYDEIANIQASSLMEANQKVWELIKGPQLSLKQVVKGNEEWMPVSYIQYDPKKIHENEFLVVNQMSFTGKSQNSIPDLVVFLNGLPVAVIECKAPGAIGAWETAYNDLQHYQGNSEKLFYYNQLLIGIWKRGGRYGAINAPIDYFSFYRSKDDKELKALVGEDPTEQDKLIFNLFRKEILLDLIRHFIIFELEEGTTIKKLPRYHQIRAVNKTISKLQQGEGGVVWHTQGSGKSLTMGYLARKLQADEFGFENPTVLILTDRKDLDGQISTTFRNIGFKNVYQASSVVHLDLLLRNDYGGIITTTLQKFQEADKEITEPTEKPQEEEQGRTLIEKYIQERTLIKITKVSDNGKWVETKREEIELEKLSEKENIYVLVDEAHRSHYGFLASFMRTVLPKAKFVAFTGTPISKEDKSTLAEFYGGDYLDTYTIREAVEDGATVELLYDEGIAKLDVKKKELDEEFKKKFGEESEEKKNKLKQEALRKHQFSAERIRDISRHILNHYSDKIFKDKHKAMIVCDGRHSALRYKEEFEKLKAEGYHNFESKVLVSMGSPKEDEIAKEYYEILKFNSENLDNPKPIYVTAPEEVKATSENFKLPFGDESVKEKSGKKKHDNTAFLIVSDMLLTGYDAPIASCLYLDKPLKEHTLLQAIARVNRSRKGKKAGFIVDYCGITDYLINALEIFSGDVTLGDILKKLEVEIPKLEMNHAKLVDFFKPLKIDRNYESDKFIDKAVQYIEPLDKRDEFKELFRNFNKSLNVVLPKVEAMRFRNDFVLFNQIKNEARNAFPEDQELRITKNESKMLQELIDEHLKSLGVESLLEDPISIIDKEKFKENIMNASPTTKELKMRNNLIHIIKVGLDRNPDFFKPLSERLEELLRQKELDQITQAQLLIAYSQLQDEIIDENKEGKEKGFTSEKEIAVFVTIKTIFQEQAEYRTKVLFESISEELEIVGWENKLSVKKDIEDKIVMILIEKLERSIAKQKAKELVDILKKNTNA